MKATNAHASGAGSQHVEACQHCRDAKCEAECNHLVPTVGASSCCPKCKSSWSTQHPVEAGWMHEGLGTVYGRGCAWRVKVCFLKCSNRYMLVYCK